MLILPVFVQTYVAPFVALLAVLCVGVLRAQGVRSVGSPNQS